MTLCSRAPGQHLFFLDAFSSAVGGTVYGETVFDVANTPATRVIYLVSPHYFEILHRCPSFVRSFLDNGAMNSRRSMKRDVEQCRGKIFVK